MAADSLMNLGDVVSLAALRRGPVGVTWFHAAVVEVRGRRLPVAFPRLVMAKVEPDDAFIELVEWMVSSGNSLGATLLLPRRVTTPADLWEPRLADVKDPERMGSPPVLNVPTDVLQAHLAGDRDRGRNAAVKGALCECVGQTVAYDILDERPPTVAGVAALRKDNLAADQTKRILELTRRADQAEAKKGQRHRRNTRSLLAAHGVIPWACWPDAELPGRWLESDELRQALREWHDQGGAVARSAQIVERAIAAVDRAA